MSLCHHHSLAMLLPSCDRCGAVFSFSHALDRHKSARGLVTQWHNEVRDALGDLAALECKKVTFVPIICDRSDASPNTG